MILYLLGTIIWVITRQLFGGITNIAAHGFAVLLTGLIIIYAFYLMVGAVFYKPGRNTPTEAFSRTLRRTGHNVTRATARGLRRVITVWIPALYRRIFNWFNTNSRFVPTLTGWRRTSLCRLIAVLLVIVII